MKPPKFALIRWPLIASLCLTFSLAAEDPQPLADPAGTLRDGFGTSPSPAQFEAFRTLVQQGAKGWAVLIDTEFELGSSGATTRRIHSFWETGGVPESLITGYENAWEKELLKRVTNETWALLYARDCEESEFHARSESELDRLDAEFDAIKKSANPADALIHVASLRVILVATADFPGHRFPWHGTAEQQKDARQDLLKWWSSHREKFKREDG
jgi:hypothetical protein